MDQNLRRLYRENRAPVAYLDESYQVKDGHTFYILACAVVNADDVASTREVLSAYYGGETMHASHMHHRREIETLRGGISLASSQHDGMDLVVVSPVELDDETGTHARRQCLEYALPMVHDEFGTTLFVLDGLESREAIRHDRFTFADLRKNARLPRVVREIHTRPSGEPLLGLPDLLAWSFRQRLVSRDPSWFDPFEEAAAIHFLQSP